MLKLNKTINKNFMARYSAIKMTGAVLIDGIMTLLCFPLWWYSKGFFKVLKGSGNFIKDFELTLGFFIWLKNLFVPMFGQRDIAGRIISFVLRLVQIILRGIALLFIIFLAFAFIIFWLILPLFVIYQIIIHI